MISRPCWMVVSTVQTSSAALYRAPAALAGGRARPDVCSAKVRPLPARGGTPRAPLESCNTEDQARSGRTVGEPICRLLATSSPSANSTVRCVLSKRRSPTRPRCRCPGTCIDAVTVHPCGSWSYVLTYANSSNGAPDFVARQLLAEVLHLLAARLQRRRDLLLRAAAAVAQLPPAGRLPPVAENPASLCS